MDKNDINISWSDLIEVKREPSKYDSLMVSVTDTGSLCLNGKLRQKLKDTDGLIRVKIYKTEDLKVIAIKSCSDHEEFKFPKNGVIKYPKLLLDLRRKGFSIPAKYILEWNDKLDMWVGKINEVSTAPRVKRRGKNEDKNV